MKGYHLVIQKKEDGLPFESAPAFDLWVKSLDAASALLHMVAQTCTDETEISIITLYNLDNDEKK